MKKYKVYPVNSFFHYQRARKRKRIMAIVAILAGIIGSIIFVVTSNLGEKLAFRLPFFNKAGKYIESVYLGESSINYHLFDHMERVRGIYIPSSKIHEYERYIKLAKESGINAFVIDIKNDQGCLTFNTANQTAIEAGAVLEKPPITDMNHMMNRLYEEGIYPIARVVAFKDNVIPKKYPERAIKSLNGQVYETSTKDTWLDPYNQKNWEYLLEISDEAVALGFKEIQFDYIRFHESMSSDKVILDEQLSKREIITAFTKYACEHLQEKGAFVSADVFGAVILSKLDADIVGQDFEKMSQYLDYICPMVYPSHYAEGTFGIAYPHLDAYGIILKTMHLGQDIISEETSSNHQATIRPWLQDFTLKSLKPYLKYGPEHIKAQIKATYDAGLDEWLFWNAAGNYTTDGFK